MRCLLLVLGGTLFCAVAAYIADRFAWIVLIANGFLPSVAIPVAAGLTVSRSHVAQAALAGAVSSAALVLASYGATRARQPGGCRRSTEIRGTPVNHVPVANEANRATLVAGGVPGRNVGMIVGYPASARDLDEFLGDHLETFAP